MPQNAEHKHDYSEGVKIGARILTEEQAAILLPSYGKIITQIESFRDEAKRVNESRELHTSKEKEKKNIHEWTFRNTISILGGRGSGKTSVLMTLKHYHPHRKSSANDIILPLLPPDHLSEQNDALGWILGHFQTQVESLEQKKNTPNHDGFDLCVKGRQGPLSTKFHELKNTYIYRKSYYHQVIQQRDEGMSEYNNHTEHFIQSDLLIIEKFKKFIDQLVIQKKKASEAHFEPLIFIYFDDVDISAERCPQILDLIRIYLSHPNIVVLVSGDYDVFSEIMTLEFLQKEGIHATHLDVNFMPDQREDGTEERTSLQSRKIRSQEYLKKVLPPTMRFEMKKLNDREKADFFYLVDSEEVSSSKYSLKTMISNIKFVSADKTFVQLFGESDIDKTSVLDSYFRFFDDNPRGLINPYYFLYQRNEKGWDLQDINRFLEILIHSSEVLNLYKHELYQIINVVIRTNDAGEQELNLELTDIDFEYLNAFYETRRSHVGSQGIGQLNEEFIQLYLIAHFFGRLIRLANDDFKYDNTRTLLLSIFNSSNRNIALYPDVLMPRLLLLHNKIQEVIPPFHIKKLFSDVDLLNRKKTTNQGSCYYEEKYYRAVAALSTDAAEDDEVKLVKFFKEVFNSDENWAKRHIDFIFMISPSIPEIYKRVTHDIGGLFNQYTRINWSLPDTVSGDKTTNLNKVSSILNNQFLAQLEFNDDIKNIDLKNNDSLKYRFAQALGTLSLKKKGTYSPVELDSVKTMMDRILKDSIHSYEEKLDVKLTTESIEALTYLKQLALGNLVQDRKISFQVQSEMSYGEYRNLMTELVQFIDAKYPSGSPERRFEIEPVFRFLDRSTSSVKRGLIHNIELVAVSEFLEEFGDLYVLLKTVEKFDQVQHATTFWQALRNQIESEHCDTRDRENSKFNNYVASKLIEGLNP